METKILKVKVDNEDRPEIQFMTISREDDQIFKDKNAKNGDHRVHQDMLNALKALRIHLATLAEYGDYTFFEENPDELEKYTVTGFSIGGEDDHEGVTLIGQRLQNGNQVLNLIIPFQKFNPEHSTYSYCESMAVLVYEAMKEADLYLSGKYRPSNQLSLFGDESKEEAA